jgi:hypothetical protein
MAGDYSSLAVSTVLAAPAQFLYFRMGRRYDLGAILFVAAGAFAVAAMRAPSIAQGHAQAVLAPLLTAAVTSVVLRVITLHYLDNRAFTLVSLGAMWVTPPLIAFALQSRNLYAGLYSGSAFHARPVLGAAVALSAAAAAVAIRLRLPTRLLAFSDSREDYKILIGSPLMLALQTETFSCSLYLLAGIAFGLVQNNLSVASFETEAIWMLLGVAVVPRYVWWQVALCPLAILIIRYLMHSLLNATYAAAGAYLALIVVVAIRLGRDMRFSRVARA